MIKFHNMETPKLPFSLEPYSSQGDDFSALDKKIVSGMFNVASSPYGSIDLTKPNLTSEASEAVYEVPLGPQFAFAG